jgi:hypothetical protein
VNVEEAEQIQGSDATRPRQFLRGHHFRISTTMSALTDDGLRQRIPQQREEPPSSPKGPEPDDVKRDQVVWGKTPSGQGAHRVRT